MNKIEAIFVKILTEAVEEHNIGSDFTDTEDFSFEVWNNNKVMQSIAEQVFEVVSDISGSEDSIWREVMKKYNDSIKK